MNLDWQCVQCFGEKNEDSYTESDIISAIQFNKSGEYLATGDRGGRVVLFRQQKGTKQQQFKEYQFYTEFQSHEPEFDYLKSLEIEEKINKLKWLPFNTNGNFLLSTNDKTIKLWKIYEKGNPSVIAAQPKKSFQHAHAYHINSISVNSDGCTFLSADDLRVNLWDLSHPDKSFNIVDMKPPNMEELTEVITAAQFHPISCNLLAYAISRGCIKLCDMRQNALLDQSATNFGEEEDPAARTFFSEIISSISDVQFSPDGNYLLARDYLHLKIWDVRNNSKPVNSIAIHDQLRSKLCDLYENDCIFDKFECTWSGDSEYCLTGSYSNYFHIYGAHTGAETVLQADKVAFKQRKMKKKTTGITLLI